MFFRVSISYHLLSSYVRQVVAGCYCVESFSTCEDLALSVSAGSFAGSSGK